MRSWASNGLAAGLVDYFFGFFFAADLSAAP